MAEIMIILYQEVSAYASEDEKDTLVQVEFVVNALRGLGYEPKELPLTLDLERARRELKDQKPAAVFNLVESLGGRGEFIHFAGFLLESLAIPFTGASAQALFLTSHKLLAKEIMRQSGIPTPGWHTAQQAGADSSSVFFPCIVKNVWEHASIGIDDDAVIKNEADLKMKCRDRQGRFFFEEYIDGREFNLSLLETEAGPIVLPVAEIRFLEFPPGKPRIVGFKAKWENESFEYKNTVRRFDFPETDSALLATLKETSLRCWNAFALTGYARVDFRVDQEGRPFVLEINANPCLSPDAGFYKAAERAGYTETSLIGSIIAAAKKEQF